MDKAIKKSTALIVIIVMFFTQFSTFTFANENSNVISDVKGHWAETVILDWIEKEYVKGYPDGTFVPSNNITRAEFISLLDRVFMLEDSETTAKKFVDVTQKHWYYKSVMLSSKFGIISGYNDNSFRPNDFITRQDASIIVSRYLNINDIIMEGELNQYSDKDDISNYAKDGIAALSELSIVKGNGDGTFNPLGNLTRAETVVMLNNALEIVGGSTGIIGKAYYQKSPLENVDIIISEKDSYKEIKKVKTDKQGNYNITLKEGVYNIIVSINNKVSFRSEINVRDDFKSYVKIGLEEGQKVVGTLKDANNKNVKTKSVYIKTNPYFTTETNDKGEFEAILPKGRDYEIFYVYSGKLKSAGKFSTSSVEEVNIGDFKTTYRRSSSSSSKTTHKKPNLELVDDNGVLEFKVTNTENTSTYTMNVKHNDKDFEEISTIDVNNPIIINKEAIAGTYAYKVISKSKNGQTKESNQVNYMVTSMGSGIIENDSDLDGLSDDLERKLNSDINNKDTDSDGLPDGFEYYMINMSPTKADSDDNGVSDADEDPDNDGLSNLTEYNLGTHPLLEDTDDDGLKDGEEINTYKTDALCVDTDGDTLSDADEIILGFSPIKNDTNGNGILDSEEKVRQTVGEDNIANSLLEDNDAIPSLTLSATGNVNNTAAISEYTGIEFGESRSIIGKPIKISGAEFESAEITFSLNSDIESHSAITVAEEVYNKKIICRYDDKGNTIYYHTDYDRKNKMLSAQIDSPGIYFVLDVEELFNELGFSLPTKMTHSTTEISMAMEEMALKENKKVLTSQQIQSMQNNSDQNKAIATFSTKHSTVMSEVYSTHKSVSASADTTKMTVMAGATGQADIVFIMDTTGSMGDEINNVIDNTTAFVDHLKERGIAPYLSLVEYKDIVEDGMDSTKVYKNGTKNWFSDVEAYKNVIKTLDVYGGGDEPECVIDALETARLLDMRSNAGKFFILITDAGYKIDNRYGIPSLEYEIELLKNQKINTSVVTSSWLESTYNDLFSQTGGIYADINGDFKDELMAVANQIVDDVEDGVWIYLDGAIPIPVKLEKEPTQGDIITDTDKDGIPDIQELKSVTPVKELDLDDIIIKVSNGAITDTNYGVIKVYEYESNPAVGDTDGDGYGDADDLNPKVAFRTPVILLHGRTDNSYKLFGAKTEIIGEGHTKLKGNSLNYQYIRNNVTSYGNINRSETNTNGYNDGETIFSPVNYYTSEAHDIKEIVAGGDKKNEPHNLAYQLAEVGNEGYEKNVNLFVLNYPNIDFNWKNADILKWFIEENLKENKAVYPTKSAYNNRNIEGGTLKVDLIGHSNGGLVSRYYIENLNGSSYVNKLITINTPHWGSGLATLSVNIPVLTKPMDMDLAPDSQQFGGSKRVMNYSNKEKQEYISNYQTQALNYSQHGTTKYYFIGGYDDNAPYLLPSGLKGKTLLFDVTPQSSTFENFRNSIADGFYKKYPEYKSTIKFIFTDIGGDNVVNNQSQLGVTYQSFGDGKQVAADAYTMLIDTIFGHNPINSFHSQAPHREETISKVIEYLNQ